MAVEVIFKRLIGHYDFEGGGAVSIMVEGQVETSEALKMVNTLVELKREELVKCAERDVI